MVEGSSDSNSNPDSDSGAGRGLASGPVPEDVRTLLRESIGSFEQLALVLRIHGAGGRPCGLEELVSALNLPADVAREALAGLLHGGLVRVEGGGAAALWSWACADPATDAAVARLQKLYRDNPVVILQLLSSDAIQRVRSSAHLAFADAFVFRKGDRHG